MWALPTPIIPAPTSVRTATQRALTPQEAYLRKHALEEVLTEELNSVLDMLPCKDTLGALGRRLRQRSVGGTSEEAVLSDVIRLALTAGDKDELKRQALRLAMHLQEGRSRMTEACLREVEQVLSGCTSTVLEEMPEDPIGMLGSAAG